MPLWRTERWSTETGEVIAEELEAYLHGWYVLYLTATRQPVPSWALLNTLAHGSEDEVTRLAAGRDSRTLRRAIGPSWQQALALMATEILWRAHNANVAISVIQRVVIVPIELRAASSLSSPRIEEIVAKTMEALARWTDSLGTGVGWNTPAPAGHTRTDLRPSRR